jgi:hypothetical protein
MLEPDELDPVQGRTAARAWMREKRSAGLDFAESDETNIAFAEAIVLLAGKHAKSSPSSASKSINRARRS